MPLSFYQVRQQGGRRIRSLFHHFVRLRVPLSVNLKPRSFCHRRPVGLLVRFGIDEALQGLYAGKIAILLYFVDTGKDKEGGEGFFGIELKGELQVGEGEVGYFFLKSASALLYSSLFLA